MSARPSATLFREGNDLDEVLADLDEEYSGQVRVVDVSYHRDGGVMGFFARRRVGVRYAVEDGDMIELASGPLDHLLRAADAADAAEAEQIVRSGRPARAVTAEGDDTTGNVEFARMLLEMANAKAAERRAAEQVATGLPEPVAPPAPAAPLPAAPVASAPADPVGPEPAAPAAPLPPIAPPPPAPRISAPAPPVPPLPAAPLPPPARPVRRVPVAPAQADDTARRRTVGAHRADPVEDGSRTEYTLRRQLVELGVPVHWVPERASDAYWVIEQLAARVPTADIPDLAPGAILAVAGPAVEVMRAARQLCDRLHLDREAILAAGLPAGTVAEANVIDQRWQAAARAAEIRAARQQPAVVVVATDAGPADDPWPAGIVAALAADRLWLVVDAARKPADSRTLLARIGRPDALVVTGAAETTSPASVWELGVPIASLDGRPASRGAWAVLLIDKLAALEA